MFKVDEDATVFISEADSLRFNSRSTKRDYLAR